MTKKRKVENLNIVEAMVEYELSQEGEIEK